MALDKLTIGIRIRSIREDRFKETRANFADRCGLKESHIGQIERGEILISLKALDKIVRATGESMDFILYGKDTNKNLQVRKNIDMFLNHSSKDELKMYYECMSSVKKFFYKNK